MGKLAIKVEGETLGELKQNMIAVANAIQLAGAPAAEAPAKPRAAKPAAAPAEVEVEEENLDAFGESTEEAEPADEPKYTKDQVLKAVNAYYKAKGKEKATKLLTKFKVKSAHDIQPEQYDDVMALAK